jgi:AAA domain
MPTNNDLLKRAIEAVSVRQVIAKFGRGAEVPERDGVKFSSILRADRNPSCSIADGRYHDWSQDRHLDSYSFFQELSGLDSKKAFVPFIELSPYAHELNGNGSHSFKNGSSNKLDWPALVKNVSEQDLQELASWRGYTDEFCRWLVSAGYIGRKGPSWAFPVFSNGMVVAAHIRQDKSEWRYEPKLNSRTTPLVLGDLGTAERIVFTESQWDAFSILDALGVYNGERVAAVATRGASNGKLVGTGGDNGAAELILVPQNDEAGQKWLDAAKANLKDPFKIVRVPKEYDDANDWHQDCGDIRGAIEAAPIEHSEGAKKDEDQAESIRELTGASFLEFSKRPIDQSKALLGDRYLCSGGAWLVVAPSGHGKSTLAAQASILLACGLPAFGIKPPRPIRSFVIQSEDDDGDITEMSQIIDYLQLTAEQRALVGRNTHVEFVNDATGNRFLKICDQFLTQWPCDLLWINPYTAYLGADIKDDEANCLFLRNGPNPLLTKHNCAAVPVHHTPTTNFRNAENWKPSDWMYAGAGAAVLTNWARAIMVIDPCEETGTYRFIAAKRGKRIGWGNDHSGLYVTYWSHCREEAKLLWIPATEAEIKASVKSKLKAEDILEFVSPVEPRSKHQIHQLANEKAVVGRDKLSGFLQDLLDLGKISVTTAPRANARPEVKYVKNAVIPG